MKTFEAINIEEINKILNTFNEKIKDYSYLDINEIYEKILNNKEVNMISQNLLPELFLSLNNSIKHNNTNIKQKLINDISFYLSSLTDEEQFSVVIDVIKYHKKKHDIVDGIKYFINYINIPYTMFFKSLLKTLE